MAINLNGTWKLGYFDPGDGLKKSICRPTYDDTEWVAVAVPGEVHVALRDAAIIEDPFYDRNAEKCRWMEDREFWYRRSFDLPDTPPDEKTRYVLRFYGLDTYATVYLNGEEIGEQHNMFTVAEFDVTDRLRYDDINYLSVRFDPPGVVLADRSLPKDWYSEFHEKRVWMRKAQMSYAWDWAPRLPAVGIWQEVELLRYKIARIESVFFRTLSIAPESAEVSVQIDTREYAPGAELQARVSLARDGRAIGATLSLVNGEGTLKLTIREPTLWWTHDLGDPSLYNLRVELIADGGIVDVHEEKVGIRTIELDQSPDPEENAMLFAFRLNGVRIFAKGANWAPADSFIGAINEARYRTLLELSREANMNMLRVNGVGLYEKPAFYRLCDELGILIWQDFMFACAFYPDHDPEFRAAVTREAEEIVRRLRNHPCIALWCGNNENDQHGNEWDWQHPWADFPGKWTCHEMLPKVTARLDPSRPYWPSSPYGGSDHNSALEGDKHNWQVWSGRLYPRLFGEELKEDHSPEGVSYRHYAEDMGRFISEFGMHAAPILETLRRNVPSSDLYWGSDALAYRSKEDLGPFKKANWLMEAHTGLPTSLEDYIERSMMAQAEGLKFGIEHYRRRKPHCSGTLIWQLNDCWPGISWSVLDYYAFPKAGYFYLKRAYAPVLASFREETGGVSLWIMNDTLEVIQDEIHVIYGDFEGHRRYEKALRIQVGPNTLQRVVDFPWEELGRQDPKQEYIAIRSSKRLFPDNRLFFVEIKDLVRPTPQVSVEITCTEEGCQVRLRTDVYAYFVHAVVPIQGTRYDDNYFDIWPGEERAIQIRSVEGREITADDIQVRWR